MSLLVCVAVQKKLNFDLLTLSSGSGGGGGSRRGGGTRGGSQQFFVILRHPTLYWASLAKEVMPYSTQTTNPQNHKESINVRICGELYFFQPIRDVLRFS